MLISGASPCLGWRL